MIRKGQRQSPQTSKGVLKTSNNTTQRSQQKKKKEWDSLLTDKSKYALSAEEQERRKKLFISKHNILITESIPVASTKEIMRETKAKMKASATASSHTSPTAPKRTDSGVELRDEREDIKEGVRARTKLSPSKSIVSSLLGDNELLEDLDEVDCSSKKLLSPNSPSNNLSSPSKLDTTDLDGGIFALARTPSRISSPSSRNATPSSVRTDVYQIRRRGSNGGNKPSDPETSLLDKSHASTIGSANRTLISKRTNHSVISHSVISRYPSSSPLSKSNVSNIKSSNLDAVESAELDDLYARLLSLNEEMAHFERISGKRSTLDDSLINWNDAAENPKSFKAVAMSFMELTCLSLTYLLEGEVEKQKHLKSYAELTSRVNFLSESLVSNSRLGKPQVNGNNDKIVSNDFSQSNPATNSPNVGHFHETSFSSAVTPPPPPILPISHMNGAATTDYLFANSHAHSPAPSPQQQKGEVTSCLRLFSDASKFSLPATPLRSQSICDDEQYTPLSPIPHSGEKVIETIEEIKIGKAYASEALECKNVSNSCSGAAKMDESLGDEAVSITIPSIPPSPCDRPRHPLLHKF